MLLDTLTSYLTRSFEQGWVAQEGLRRSLQAKLDAARRQLAHGNSQAAVNVLEAFVNEVEAQREKQLSGEAYALLRFNAAYLIEHIE